jgi:hypothetical protein
MIKLTLHDSNHGELLIEETCASVAEDTQAVNDEGGDVNVAFDHENGDSDTIPAVAKRLKSRAQPWALIVDENYGEVRRQRRPIQLPHSLST